LCFFVPEWTFQPWNREQASAQTLATTKATHPTRSLESPLIQSPIEIVDGGYYPAPQGYFFAGRLRVRVLPFAAWATFFFIVLGLRLGAVALRLPAVFLARGLGLGCGDCSDFVAPSTTSVVFATIVPTAVPNFSAMVTISGVLSTVFAMSPPSGDIEVSESYHCAEGGGIVTLVSEH